MPLSKKAPMRQNVIELMKPTENTSRLRAIATIAKKNNISFAEAQFKQSLAIAKSLKK